jgi:hypothetical protein
VKSQVQLLEHLLQDAADALRFNPARDLHEITERYGHEGETFLTVAMPRLDDILIEGLRDGRLPKFLGWATHGGVRYPAFLAGIWRRIFHENGELRATPDVHAIRWLRQISRVNKKIFEVCSQDRVDSAVSRWIDLDRSLPSKQEIASAVDPYVPFVAQILFGATIGSAMTSPLKGKHGPGVVSEKFGPNSRWDFTLISEQAAMLAGEDFFRPTWSSLADTPPLSGMVPSRLVAVPKTAEKPRLICIEPSYNQFLQQALMANLKQEFEDRRLVCGFTYQDFNREGAREGSITGRLATIDLSDASDRVSMALVEHIFGFNHSFVRFLRLSRTPFVQLPDGNLMLPRKFASMGSALTFPVEAMVFTVLVVTSICRELNDFRPSTIRSWGKRGRGLSVYGDDIVIPVEYSHQAIGQLEASGLKVNESKSFLHGKFRESCGLDAFDGYEVSPVYLRQREPLDRNHVTELISWVSFRNQMFNSHLRDDLYRTLKFLDSFLNDRGVTYVPSGTICVGLETDDSTRPVTRWNAALQRLEVKSLKPIHTYVDDVATDHGKLFKSFHTNKGALGPLAVLELEREARRKTHGVTASQDVDMDVRPVATKLYYRWLAAG